MFGLHGTFASQLLEIYQPAIGNYVDPEVTAVRYDDCTWSGGKASNNVSIRFEFTCVVNKLKNITQLQWYYDYIIFCKHAFHFFTVQQIYGILLTMH